MSDKALEAAEKAHAAYVEMLAAYADWLDSEQNGNKTRANFTSRALSYCFTVRRIASDV